MGKTIVPKSSKRSLELIIRDNPTMTGSQIVAEFEYDKHCYEMWQRENEAKLYELAADLEVNKFFKITYHCSNNLLTYLKITKTRVMDSAVYFEAIESKVSTSGNQIFVETQREVTHRRWDNYVTGVKESETCIDITEEQYEAFQLAVRELYRV